MTIEEVKLKLKNEEDKCFEKLEHCKTEKEKNLWRGKFDGIDFALLMIEKIHFKSTNNNGRNRREGV